MIVSFFNRLSPGGAVQECKECPCASTTGEVMNFRALAQVVRGANQTYRCTLDSRSLLVRFGLGLVRIPASYRAAVPTNCCSQLDEWRSLLVSVKAMSITDGAIDSSTIRLFALTSVVQY